MDGKHLLVVVRSSRRASLAAGRALEYRYWAGGAEGQQQQRYWAVQCQFGSDDAVLDWKTVGNGTRCMSKQDFGPSGMCEDQHSRLFAAAVGESGCVEAEVVGM